jgi:cytochrome d ubiquinol oxidase subunit II
VAGVVAIAGVFVLRNDAPRLYRGLTHRGLPVIIISALAGLATLFLVWGARYAWARYTAALAVVAVLLGWAAGQYPYMLENTLTIKQAAGAHATLVAILVVLGFGLLFLVPALVALYVMSERGTLVAEH